MGQYLPIIVLLVLAILFGAISFLASTLLAPKRPHAAKEAPYECGIVPGREPPQRFPVSFYIVAMLFIMFDIEIIFVYPYAVDREFLGSFAFFEMLAFSAVFFVAFVYVVARGALDWGPIQRAGRIDSLHDGVISANRTTTSTIRRVGAEGRIEIDREGAAA
ncbi:MAG: NADH-quinone oxidoreductase subunit A [Ilumatobacteraceae bacterium]